MSQCTSTQHHNKKQIKKFSESLGIRSTQVVFLPWGKVFGEVKQWWQGRVNCTGRHLQLCSTCRVHGGVRRGLLVCFRSLLPSNQVLLWLPICSVLGSVPGSEDALGTGQFCCPGSPRGRCAVDDTRWGPTFRPTELHCLRCPVTHISFFASLTVVSMIIRPHSFPFLPEHSYTAFNASVKSASSL